MTKLTDERIAEIENMCNRVSTYGNHEHPTARPFVDTIAELLTERAGFIDELAALKKERQQQQKAHKEKLDNFARENTALKKAAIRDGRGGFVDGCVSGSEYLRVHEGQRKALEEVDALKRGQAEALSTDFRREINEWKTRAETAEDKIEKVQRENIAFRRILGPWFVTDEDLNHRLEIELFAIIDEKEGGLIE